MIPVSSGKRSVGRDLALDHHRNCYTRSLARTTRRSKAETVTPCSIAHRERGSVLPWAKIVTTGSVNVVDGLARDQAPALQAMLHRQLYHSLCVRRRRTKRSSLNVIEANYGAWYGTLGAHTIKLRTDSASSITLFACSLVRSASCGCPAAKPLHFSQVKRIRNC